MIPFRSTKRYDIQVSDDNVNWYDFKIGTILPNNANYAYAYAQYVYGPQLRVRYIRFILREFYGAGGGLSYFLPNYYYGRVPIKFA